MTVIGLLLAFLALLKPLLTFRLRVSRLSGIGVLWILIASFACNLVSLALRLNAGWRWPVIGYPIFWELLAALMLVALVVQGLMISWDQVRFGRHNAKRYYETFIGIISRGDFEEMSAMATEVYPSIEEVISTCSEYANQRMTVLSDTPGIKPSDYVRYVLLRIENYPEKRRSAR